MARDFDRYNPSYETVPGQLFLTGISVFMAIGIMLLAAWIRPEGGNLDVFIPAGLLAALMLFAGAIASNTLGKSGAAR